MNRRVGGGLQRQPPLAYTVNPPLAYTVNPPGGEVAYSVNP